MPSGRCTLAVVSEVGSWSQLCRFFSFWRCSFDLTRIATVALQLTGLSKANARFQARSAFTGVGYTTSEAEDTVNHPVAVESS